MSDVDSSAPLRIVSIGGGTGLSTLLRGLKRYVRASDGLVEITAIVTVTDDGGSSGRLRREFDVLPPGDIRNCMVALSGDEALLTRLFQYRFSSGRGLKGHSFGNLFLMAMTHVTGDFSEAVKASAKILAVSGRIYPATRSNVSLEATLEDGTQVSGETRISRSTAPIRKIALKPRRVQPLPEALQAIADADLITLGPGSLFTSVIPNLLVEGIPRAIAQARATKAYFQNLMSQPGETTGMSASQHLEALLRHCPRHRRSLVDVCVVNTHPIAASVLDSYSARQARAVEIDSENIAKLGVEVLGADLLRRSAGHAGDTAPGKIRHESGTLAAVAIDLARQARKAHRKIA